MKNEKKIILENISFFRRQFPFSLNVNTNKEQNEVHRP